MFFFWLHVHEVEHCLCRHFTHINFVRFETMIWPRIEFKKSLDIFWPRLERRRSEEYLDYFDRLWAFFLPRVHLEIQQMKHGENLQGFINDSGFSEILHFQYISSWINIVVLLNVSLNYIIFLFWLFVNSNRFSGCCFQSYVNIVCRRTQMNMEFRSERHTKIILKPLPISVHSITQQLALEVWTQLGKIQKWIIYIKGRVILEIILKVDILERFCSKPITSWPDWTVPSNWAFSLYLY